MKNIFQFKMSSKYSKGDCHTNKDLINRIYSREKRNKFTKTITLLELEFHQYYHYIFLGEKKDWYLFFDLKEKDNEYQLDFFLKNEEANSVNDLVKYKN